MVTDHTYFFAATSKREGAHRDNEALTDALAALYAANRGSGETTAFDGASAWRDEAGTVQLRVVRDGVSHAIEDDAALQHFSALLGA